MNFSTRFFRQISFVLFAVFFFSGCATVIQPGPDHIMVNSEPEGAKVFLNGMPVGTTPMQLSINRADDGNLMLKKDGYESVQYSRNKVVAGWVFADLIFWPSFIVDLVTHSQGKYSEDPIFVSMQPSKQPATQPTAEGTAGGNRGLASPPVR